MSSIREFNPPQSDRGRSAGSSSALLSGLAHDMRARWDRGERIRVEDYFVSHPRLLDDPDAALGLIYEELCLCEEAGEPVTLPDLVRRFPQWEDRLTRLLDCRNLLSLGPDSPEFPECGDVLGRFRLVAELGEGKHGKVFLATEPTLADRSLVLKLTAASGCEHLSLALLQHTNIVPLYFVEDDLWPGIRVLGMPFFGGASLERFLHRMRQRPIASRTGKDFVEWLTGERRMIPAELDVSTERLERLAQVSYASIVCYIGARIAEAIQYAHDKGLVHLDLKPSNVLLTADGEPMLLDFHLAREPIRAGKAAPLWLGGTTRYMSPEQAVVFAAISQGGAIPCDVDGRSDIYSLGLLLYELLGGSSPLSPEGPAALLDIARRTSVGLADILAKCLSPDPAGRYATAADLAADLNSHLKNEPLREVSNRSIIERWRKWRRRAPHSLRNWCLFAGLLGTLGATVALVWQREQGERAQSQLLLDEGRQRLAEGQAELARRAFSQSLQAAEGTLRSGELLDEINHQLRRARQMELLHGFHGLMDELRSLYGFEPLPHRAVLDILPRCQKVWAQRTGFLQRTEDPLEPKERDALLNDLLELAMLWTDLRIRTSTPRQLDAIRSEILAMLDEAESLAGASAAVAYKKASLSGVAADFDVNRALESFQQNDSRRAAWESYALGLALLNDERLAAASQCLAYAVRQQPGSQWTQYYYGRCQFQLRDHAEAARAFSACIALAPKHAGAYYNRAVVYEALDERERALRDYDQALVIDPGLAQAALNRGILRYTRHDLPEAQEDLQRALALGADPVAANYNLAVVALALGKNAEAAAFANRVLQRSPNHAGARKLLQALENP